MKFVSKSDFSFKIARYLTNIFLFCFIGYTPMNLELKDDITNGSSRLISTDLRVNFTDVKEYCGLNSIIVVIFDYKNKPIVPSSSKMLKTLLSKNSPQDPVIQNNYLVQDVAISCIGDIIKADAVIKSKIIYSGSNQMLEFSVEVTNTDFLGRNIPKSLDDPFVFEIERETIKSYELSKNVRNGVKFGENIKFTVKAVLDIDDAFCSQINRYKNEIRVNFLSVLKNNRTFAAIFLLKS